MRFYSKKGPLMSLIIWGIILVGPGSAIYQSISGNGESNAFDLFVPLLAAAFVAWLWFTTFYEIHGETLVVRSGPVKKVIHIKTIRNIRKTRNPLSSPALSMDRIEISYNIGDLVLISPKDKEAFIAELKKINKNIAIDLK
ncbi:PH domain-containing protein [Peribacillus glennii]|uniref:Uncharacterized protein YyaB-like PH domain-containing protein n=1 Tax=Peribacillus glennii TaxID=2303991 RepID=A0A372L8B5_9BACI|nr:PH domain-containing protein [Peribacillus glennii]RFU60573.1 hypothetical protein D0466_21385 [Peribacillus glennii]